MVYKIYCTVTNKFISLYPERFYFIIKKIYIPEHKIKSVIKKIELYLLFHDTSLFNIKST